MNYLTETQIGYVAGIVDGEGCITIAMSKSAKHRHGTRFEPRVVVVNTDVKLVNWLHSNVGIGRVYVQSYKNPKHRDKWSWVVSGNGGTKELLETIMPVLVCKKRQAELVVEYLDGVPLFAAKSGMPLDEWYRRSSLYSNVKILNSRQC